MAKWVKLPDGAQVTMGREEYEATHSSIGPVGWILIIGVVFLILAIWPDSKESKTPDSPRPSHSVSAPAKGDSR